MLRVSPITSVVLKSGTITFFAKIKLGGTFFTATDGLVSINFRKERSLDNQISANDFQLVFADDPSNDVYFNPSFPTYPEMMNANTPVEVYLGYGRWTGVGDKKNIDNHILQWFKIMSGVTSSYAYSANGRQLSISCLDRIEELANYGNFNSVTLEYMTPRDILNIIANNVKSPPVGLQNLAQNPHFEICSDITKYPKNWGKLTDKSGFNRFYHVNNRLPRYWKSDQTQFSERFATNKKIDSDTYVWNRDFQTFDSLNGKALNKEWADTDGDGLADWWQTESGSSYSVEKKSDISDTKVQKISGASLFKFFQTTSIIDDSVHGAFYTITGIFKADTSIRFIIKDSRNYLYTSDWYSPNTYQELGATFEFSTNLHTNGVDSVGIECSGGNIYVETFDFNNSRRMMAPAGFRVESIMAGSGDSVFDESSPVAFGKIVNTSIDGLKKSYRIRGINFNGSAIFYPDDKKHITANYIRNGSGVSYPDFTWDLIYKTDSVISSVRPSLVVEGIGDIDSISTVLNASSVNLTSTSWKYQVLSGSIFTLNSAFWDGNNTYKSITPRLSVVFGSSSGGVYIDRMRFIPGDFLGNPCFMDTNGDGIPDNYERIRSSTDYYTLIDSGNYLNMSQSLSFNSSSKNGQCITRQRLTGLEPGYIYTLLGHFMSENIETNGSEKSGIYAAVHAYNSSGSNIYSLYSPKISGFTQWERFEIPFRFDDRITDVDIQLCMQNCDGRAFFNDVFLFKRNVAYSKELDYMVELQKDESDILNDKVITASHTEWDTYTALHSGPNISPFRTLEAEFATFDEFIPTMPTTFPVLNPSFEHTEHRFELVQSPTSGYNFSVTFNKEDDAIIGKNYIVITQTGV